MHRSQFRQLQYTQFSSADAVWMLKEDVPQISAVRDAQTPQAVRR